MSKESKSCNNCKDKFLPHELNNVDQNTYYCDDCVVKYWTEEEIKDIKKEENYE